MRMIHWFDLEKLLWNPQIGTGHLVCKADLLLDFDGGVFTIGHNSIEFGHYIAEDFWWKGDDLFVTFDTYSHSEISSCSMTSETGIIDKTVQNIREVLESGGCCNSQLIHWRKLQSEINRVFEQRKERD